MTKTVYEDGDDGVRLIVKASGKAKNALARDVTRKSVHVMYGGADRFTADTPTKLGEIALRSMETYAPNFVEFANAMRLPGTESLPHYPEAVEKMLEQIERNPERAKSENPASWFAYIVHRKTMEKLRNEPVEDYRIDFEDGYGFRSDEQEDADARRSALEMGTSFAAGKLPALSGFRIKPLSAESYGRAVSTLNIFLASLVDATEGRVPHNFVVTLPKIMSAKEVKELSRLLRKFEKSSNIPVGTIGIELMIETPESIIDRKGRVALQRLVKAGNGRVTSAHFGAFDYTSAIGISAEHQDLLHPACDFARNLMQINLAPLGIRLADSVTTVMPVPIHKGDGLTEAQITENRRFVHAGWRAHFKNVSHSMANGFYQSWDLHPNQLPARYAAVYFFYLGSVDAQAQRLRRFVEQATQATLTGNIFDDAASARGVRNFFGSGLDCSAFSQEEVRKLTGLSTASIRSGSFLRIGAA